MQARTAWFRVRMLHRPASPEAVGHYAGGQHHKITHQRDKSSSEILQGVGGAKLEAKNSTFFFHPPTSPHRILAEGCQVLIEGVARQCFFVLTYLVLNNNNNMI